MAINFAQLGVSPRRQIWKPTDAGDYIVGRLSKLEQTATKWGPKVVMHLDEVSKAKSAGKTLPLGDYEAWPTTGLLESLMEAGVQDLGNTIGIKLEELVDTGKPTPFKRFKVKLIESSAAH